LRSTASTITSGRRSSARPATPAGTNLRKTTSHYPRWSITEPLPTIFEEIVDGWRRRLSA